jgi:hypothetical protein
MSGLLLRSPLYGSRRYCCVTVNCSCVVLALVPPLRRRVALCRVLTGWSPPLWITCCFHPPKAVERTWCLCPTLLPPSFPVGSGSPSAVAQAAPLSSPLRPSSSGLCLLSCSRMWLVVWCAVPRTVGLGRWCDCGATLALCLFCKTCVVPPLVCCAGGSPLLVCHRHCRALIPPQRGRYLAPCSLFQAASAAVACTRVYLWQPCLLSGAR